jgi:hypothetical protein
LVERGKSPDLKRRVDGEVLVERTLIEFDAGQPAAAQATLAQRRQSVHRREALYWLGRAQEASDASQGRAMVAEARPRLARSPVASHRRLAAADR